MTDIENYHNWLRDAHAMEKQVESLLVATIRRLDNEPQLRTRLEQHLYETRRQLSALQDIIARNHISRSALKDAMSRVAALGQTIGIMLPGDEVIKVIITAYVFAHFEVACYTALLTAAERVGDHSAMHTLEGILAEERGMADWLLHYLPALTGQYLMDTDMPGVEAGIKPPENAMVKRQTIALLAAEEQVPLVLTARQQALVDAVANRMLPAERNPVSPVGKPRAKARAGSGSR